MNNESLNFKYKLGKKYLVKNVRGGTGGASVVDLPLQLV
jgi:hypothetical protein